jgi:hypothetical protein
MSDVWERSLALIDEQGELPIFVRVHQSEGDLSLYLAAWALDRILFAASVAEFIYCYSEFKLNDNAELVYSPDVFKRFEEEIVEGLRGRDQSILDFTAEEQAKYSYLFASYLRSRKGGNFLASNSETLRVSVVEFFHENPWVFKVIAAGVSAAVLSLAAVLGGVAIAEQLDSPQCRAEASAFYGARLAAAERQARFEGHMTDVHRANQKDILNAQNAAIAACQPRLPHVKVSASNGRVEIDFGPEDYVNKKDS